MNSLVAPIRPGELSGAADRRFAERKVCRVSGVLVVQNHAPMHIKTLDLCAKGVALLLPQALPNGTVGELSFHLHSDGLFRQFVAKIAISNTVFLRSDVRAGCRFVSLGDAQRKILTDFMR